MGDPHNHPEPPLYHLLYSPSDVLPPKLLPLKSWKNYLIQILNLKGFEKVIVLKKSLLIILNLGVVLYKRQKFCPTFWRLN